jgi:hypothetical protein
MRARWSSLKLATRWRQSLLRVRSRILPTNRSTTVTPGSSTLLAISHAAARSIRGPGRSSPLQQRAAGPYKRSGSSSAPRRRWRQPRQNRPAHVREDAPAARRSRDHVRGRAAHNPSLPCTRPRSHARRATAQRYAWQNAVALLAPSGPPKGSYRSQAAAAQASACPQASPGGTPEAREPAHLQHGLTAQTKHPSCLPAAVTFHKHKAPDGGITLHDKHPRRSAKRAAYRLAGFYSAALSTKPTLQWLAMSPPCT